MAQTAPIRQDYRQKSTWAAPTSPSTGLARAIGSYARGCLAGAVALPAVGHGHAALRPQRNRIYGHPTLVAFIEDLGRFARSSGIGRVLIGDLSQPRGGPMPHGHASHQIGLDADIRFAVHSPAVPTPEFLRGGTEISMLDPSHRFVDPRRWGPDQMELLQRAATDQSVARIFVHPAIKRHLCRTLPADNRHWLQRLRPWYGHHAHFHVRLRCPTDSPDCRDQAPIGPGDGCAETLDWWFSDAARTPKPPGAPRARIDLPPACAAVLIAP